MARKKAAKPPMPAGELGSSGLRQYSGYLQEEFDPKLRGARGMEALRGMRDNSAPVGAALHAIEMVIRQVEVEVLPFSPAREDQERAEFLDGCLRDMSFSWSETVSEHLTMLPFGYALSEIVYKRREGFNDRGSQSSRYEDGRIGWAKVALRGQESITRWDLDPNGGIRGAWQQAPPAFAMRYLPIEKCLLFRVTKERNNPEGRSLFRNAYWSWYCAKRLTEIMLIGAERDLAGLPIVRIPGKLMQATATADEQAVYNDYKEIARNVRRGEQEGIVLPSEAPEGGQHYHYDLQLLASGGKREFNVPMMVQQFDRWIATVLLADLLLMGHEGVGSYALSESKTGLFETSLDGYLETIDGTYNSHAVPRLMRLNGWPADRCPRLKHKSLKPENLAALADFLQKLQASGILTPDVALEEDVRRRARLPKRPDGAPLPSPPQPPAGPAPTTAPKEKPEPAVRDVDLRAVVDGLVDGMRGAELEVGKLAAAVDAALARGPVVQVAAPAVTVEVPETPAPNVHVDVAAPQVHVEPVIDLHDLPAPSVHVDVAAPVVHVAAEEGPRDIRIVGPVETRVTQLPETVEVTEVQERDADGRLKRARKTSSTTGRQ